MVGRQPDNHDRQLDVLRSEYEQLVYRDGILIQTLYVVVGIATTVLGGLALTVPEYGTWHDPIAREPLFYLGIPLAPTILAGLLVFLTLHVNVLAQYSHAVEARISDLAGGRLGSAHLRLPGFAVDSPSFLRAGSRLFGAGRSRPTRPYNVLTVGILLAVVVLMVTVPVFALRSTPWELRVTALAIYGPLNAGLLVVFCLAHRRNRALLRDALEEFVWPATRPARLVRDGRSFPRYAAVPRTVDHHAKVLIFAVSWLLGRLALQHQAGVPLWGWRPVGEVVLTTFVFEYLVYQARYTWNDLRDIAEDSTHRRSRERGRIPTPLHRWELRTLWMTIPAKLVLGLVLVVTLVPQHAPRLVSGAVGVWVAAVAYELVRDIGRRNRIRPTEVRLRSSGLVVCIMVGAGYAVRGATALEVGSAGTVGPGLVILVAAALWLSEVSTVAMSWVFEGTEDIHRADRERPATTYDARLERKPHLGLLLRQAECIDAGTSSGEVPERPKDMPAPTVLDRRLQKRTTVWTLAGAAGFLLAGSSALVATQGMELTARWVLAGAALAVPAVVQCLFPRTGFAVNGFAVTAIALVLAAVAFDAPYPVAVGVFVLLAAVYEMTRRGNYDFTVGWTKGIKEAAGTAHALLGGLLRLAVVGPVRWFAGSGRWKALPPSERAPSWRWPRPSPTYGFVHWQPPHDPDES